MAKQSNIGIQKVIVHTINHSLDNPELTDLASILTSDVREFLEDNIALNIEHKRARKARFADDKNEVAKIYDEIISNPNTFEDCSRAIAKLLFASMKNGKGNIKPGDLVVCLYQDQQSGLQNLALLKMEPENGYFIEKVTVNNKTRAVFKQVRDIFPTKELQKCAFILPRNLRKKMKYDLIVLDQQTARYGIRRPVASFFQTGFLNCRTDLNSSEQTYLFINLSKAWIDEFEGTIPVKDAERFKQRITVAADSNVVDVASFAQEVLSEVSDQEAYISYMQEKGLESLTFVPDPEEVKKWTEYSCFVGDNDLEIRILTSAIGKDLTLEWEEDKKKGVTNVKIKTLKWDPIIKRSR
jgi:hypothetical protein